MTNLVNSSGRYILPPCWTHWYFSNHQPGEHAEAILVMGGFFITSEKPGGRRLASGADLPHQSDSSIRRFTCLLRDCDIHFEHSTWLLPSDWDCTRRLSYLLGAELDIRVLELRSPGGREDPGGSGAGGGSGAAPSTEVPGRLRAGWGSAAHTWGFGESKAPYSPSSREKECRHGLPHAKCIYWDWESFDWVFPWNWVVTTV